MPGRAGGRASNSVVPCPGPHRWSRKTFGRPDCREPRAAPRRRTQDLPVETPSPWSSLSGPGVLPSARVHFFFWDRLAEGSSSPTGQRAYQIPSWIGALEDQVQHVFVVDHEACCPGPPKRAGQDGLARSSGNLHGGVKITGKFRLGGFGHRQVDCGESSGGAVVGQEPDSLGVAGDLPSIGPRERRNSVVAARTLRVRTAAASAMDQSNANQKMSPRAKVRVRTLYQAARCPTMDPG